ncbi:MAG: hypothetical protein WDA02_03465 [Saccharofermentanales bacterium]
MKFKNIKTFEQHSSELNISDVSDSYIHWFMTRLGYGEREKIRNHYNLNEPTLKITNEIIKDIYEKELKRPKYHRLLDDRFYNI